MLLFHRETFSHDKLIDQNFELEKAKQVFDDSEVPKVLTEWYDEFSIPLIWNYGKGVEYENVKDFNCNNNYNLFADRELVCVGPMENPVSTKRNLLSLAMTHSVTYLFRNRVWLPQHL